MSDLARARAMYCQGLGLHVVASFENHEGFDGVVLGLPGAGYHFEFTRCRTHPIVAAPTAEDLTVFYLPAHADWESACARMLAAGFKQVPSLNPYWDARGRTYQDHDGYRVVLQNAEWSNVVASDSSGHARPRPMSRSDPADQAPAWELYRALREQWTHEDNLVNHRLMWLILSQGLLFTAYGTLSTARLHWLVLGFPFFGMAVSATIGVSIFAALAAIDEVNRRYEEAGLDAVCSLWPGRNTGSRGRLAAQALPFVFGALWLLALAGAFRS